MEYAEKCLAHGDQFPHDGGEKFWKSDTAIPPRPTDWAHRAARGIVAGLDERSGFQAGLDGLDHEDRAELVQFMAQVIRAALAQAQANEAA